LRARSKDRSLVSLDSSYTAPTLVQVVLLTVIQGSCAANGIGAHYRLAILCDKWEHPDNTFAQTAQQDFSHAGP
jgi:hypothetical protein